MGNLLRRLWTKFKLSRGRCLECGGIIPDVRPVPGYRACSESCADQMAATALS